MKFVPLKPEFQEDAKIVGHNLRHFRKIKNFTLEELAEKSGVSVCMIERIENGQEDVKVRLLAAIAHALEVEVARFLGPEFCALVKSIPRN